jgi:acyl-CoA synthetase (AMP-forming)/AMP-acid ligase II
MQTHWLTERLRDRDGRALVCGDHAWSYRQLAEAVARWSDVLVQRGVAPGTPLAICSDYSPEASALLLAALVNRNIIVPLTHASKRREQFMEIAQVKNAIVFDGAEAWELRTYEREITHPLLRGLAQTGTSGLILFSSGSTGESKASLLDFDKFLEKFQAPRRGYRTLVFLLLDHVGGINTLIHTLAHGGTVVAIDHRSPDAVCAAVEQHRIELLPTTPTFLRMMLISDAIRRYDLSSLETITYGTEPMPESTLTALHAAVPGVRFKQTYGLSEFGILPTRSRDSQSLWLKLGRDGFEHKIVDNVLWIRSERAMLGYLNAPSPFDQEGWFNTQDLVERDGDDIRILGRKSELINVGGEKVYPVEVENVLLEVSNVRDVTVRGRANPVTGAMVVAQVTPMYPEDPAALKQRVRKTCQQRLEPYKVPMIIEVVAGGHHTDRFKKARGQTFGPA